MNFFTSDYHFGMWDERLEKLGYAMLDVSEYQRQVMRNVNNMCKENDDLYVIGDYIDCVPHKHPSNVCMSFRKVESFRPRVHLILGNNEDRCIKTYCNGDDAMFRDYCLEVGFASVERTQTIVLQGRTFHLVHDPSEAVEGMLNLYGHFHTANVTSDVGLNVSIFSHCLRPYSEVDLFRVIKANIDYPEAFIAAYGRDVNHSLWDQYLL